MTNKGKFKSNDKEYKRKLLSHNKEIYKQLSKWNRESYFKYLYVICLLQAMNTQIKPSAPYGWLDHNDVFGLAFAFVISDPARRHKAYFQGCTNLH